jgi:hypothetical protein
MSMRFVFVFAVILLAGSVMFVLAVPPSSGSISGKVTYTGTPPKMKLIDMAKEPGCAKEHATDPVHFESVVTGPADALEWVVVYISAGDHGGAPPTQTVRYDQKGCEYIPHVAVMEVNQPMEIFNNDGWAHNIHPMPKINSEWNKSQPPGTPPIQAKWEKAEFIPVKCNIHPWMHGYFIVLNTSHYSVTGKDGDFSLKGLPPGKYTVTAWQEQYGTQSQEVTIAGNETKNINFVFKVLPY